MQNKQGFFENKVLCPYPPLNILPGAKLSKALKNFINPSSVRWAQDVASKFVQENKIEGYLYLSVDPRDYLTLSENNENWISCHSLDGDYRTGDLNYMVDNTTVVAYLCDSKDSKLRCTPLGMSWNSKKWRMLIHTDLHRVIYYNKQYPFESKKLLTYASEFLTSKLSDVFTSPVDYGFKLVQGQFENGLLPYNQINAGGRTFDMRDIIDVSTNSGFCDLIYSSVYSPVVAVNRELLNSYIDTHCCGTDKGLMKEFSDFKDLFGLKIGKYPICPVCGEHYVTREDKYLCNDCIAEYDADEDFFLKCNCCGGRVYDDEIYWFNEEPYCKHCYNELMRELEEEE